MGRSGRFAQCIVAAVALAAVAGPVSAPDAAPGGHASYLNPVIETDFPDPFVLPDGGLYYAYATNRGARNVQVMLSLDLESWSVHGDALPLLPQWARAGRTWAPTVAKLGATYVMFYVAQHARADVSCIGRAVGLTPLGPFLDLAEHPFLCQPDRGGSIDPAVFVNGFDDVWLLWKSEGTPRGEPTRVWSQRLSSDGASLRGEPAQLLVRDQRWEGRIVESPAMLRLDGRLFLFYSGGRWQDHTYAVGWAACEGPAGPCHKHPVPMVRSTGPVVGPGGQDFFRHADGSVVMAYHAWTGGAVGYPHGQRSMRIDRLVLRDGLPYLSGPTYGPSSHHGTPDAPAVALAPTTSGEGYRVLAADGDSFTYGDATQASRALGSIVDATTQPLVGGWWALDHRGTVSAGGVSLAVPPRAHSFVGDGAAIGAHPSGTGYWIVSTIGEVRAVGSAADHGSLPHWSTAPVVALAPTPTGNGYWLVQADGAVHGFGDAPRVGDARGSLRAAVTDAAPSAFGSGLWLLTSDGGIHTLGTAPFHGSAVDLVGGAAVDLAAHPSLDGYWVLSENGGVFAFGRAGYHGSNPMG